MEGLKKALFQASFYLVYLLKLFQRHCGHLYFLKLLQDHFFDLDVVKLQMNLCNRKGMPILIPPC